MSLALFAFAVAAAISLAGTPALRQLALVTGFTDRPGRHKSHSVPVAYLGGVAIIIAALTGSIIGSSSPMLGVFGLVGAGLGVVGLLDDDRLLRAGARLLFQFGSACIALIAGIRVDVSGVALFDAVLTIVWIVAITNAVNFLDNMDGLAAGIAVVAGSATALIAAWGGQTSVAAMAAALSGACVGFLAFNARPAAIYMGDAGSLFLGFVLAVLVLEVKPGVRPPSSFAVPILLLMLPVVDIVTVVVGRLRRGIPVSIGGRNHLSHRLVARGFGRGPSVVILVGVELAAAALAVAIARDAVSVVPALAVGGLLVVGLSVATVTAPVWESEPIGFHRTLRWAALSGCVALIALATPPVLTLLSARPTVAQGSAAAEQGLVALRAGDYATASHEFARSNEQLRDAARRLDSPLVSMGLAVPVLNTNLVATRRLVALADAFSRISNDLAGLAARDAIVSGISADDLANRADRFARVSENLRTGLGRLSVADSGFLVAPLRDELHGLRQQIVEALIQTERSEAFARLYPSIMGSAGPRHYLLAVQEAAMPTTYGGPFIGWSFLTVDAGVAHVADLTRVNFSSAVSTDFRVVARDLLSRNDVPGTGVDGVMAMDSAALAALTAFRDPDPQAETERLGVKVAGFFMAFDLVAAPRQVQMYLARAPEQQVIEALGAARSPTPTEAETIAKSKGG
ncbi:MAG TPA: MraY family glycosyltransferase [Ilumatobacter sp.]|nr:MraY family glycosyltransferase [Ilumatobacter sp.]